MCRVQGLAAQAGVGGAEAAGGAMLDPAIEAFEVRYPPPPLSLSFSS